MTYYIFMIIFSLITLIIFNATFFFICANTVYCLVSLILLTFLVSALLILAKLEFFAILYILIYVGIISVFFIFTIMLINMRFYKNDFLSKFEIFLGLSCHFSLSYFLHYYLYVDCSHLERLIKFKKTTPYVFEQLESMISFRSIGTVLYLNYGFFLFLVGIIMLFCLIGSLHVLSIATELMNNETVLWKNRVNKK